MAERSGERGTALGTCRRRRLSLLLCQHLFNLIPHTPSHSFPALVYYTSIPPSLLFLQRLFVPVRSLPLFPPLT